ncbi:unnamed protein product [Lactuca saligna]|uniref:Uncharacterized protein n=1 Tax=Lactuca saligna TaxID=75948 RepID=A0AA36EJ76_LACSI|nr:unnamed protein product [Lactuca saligna]
MAAGHLRHISSDLADFTAIKSEYDELKWKVLSLEKEKYKFKECYDLLDGEKAFMEDHVHEKLDIEGSKRKVQVEYMAWLLNKVVVSVVDQIDENHEFSLGVRRMKAACMAADVEGGKQVMQEQVSIEKFNPRELRIIVENIQVMHASMKAFMETRFAYYLRLGVLHMEGIRRLCIDSDTEDNQPKGSSSKFRPSSSPLGK